MERERVNDTRLQEMQKIGEQFEIKYKNKCNEVDKLLETIRQSEIESAKENYQIECLS